MTHQHQQGWVYHYTPSNTNKFFACHLFNDNKQTLGKVILTRAPRNWEYLQPDQQEPFWKLLESFRGTRYNIDSVSIRYSDETYSSFRSEHLGHIRRLLHQLVDELTMPRIVYPATETVPAKEVATTTFWDTRIDPHFDKFHVQCEKEMASSFGLDYGKELNNLLFIPQKTLVCQKFNY